MRADKNRWTYLGDGTRVRKVREPSEASEAVVHHTGKTAEEAEKQLAASVTPAAKALAEELGIDPSTIQGTGVGGKVTKTDVEDAAE